MHRAGGLIAAQLWHVGRVSHPSFHGGELPVSASALPFRGRTTIKSEDGRLVRADCPTPHALTGDEIQDLVEDYRAATRNAREAGFDLVEIHAATATCSSSSCAPTPTTAGVEMALHLATELTARDVAFLHLSEPDWVGGEGCTDDFRARLRAAFPAPLVGAGAYDVAKAERLLDAGLIDAAAFGRAFIANPDLPDRIRRGGPYNDPDKHTFYRGGPEGYVDYPALSD